MKNIIQKRVVILMIIVLSLAIQLIGFAQSASFGNTFIHTSAEMVVHNVEHNFQNGGSGVLPGIVGTERTSPQGYLGFAGTGSWIGASSSAYVDGYVKSYLSAAFTFPIGDNGKYRPAAVSAASLSNPANAAYYATSGTLAVTSSLKGGSEPKLPSGETYATNLIGSGLTSIDDVEYWDINGATSAKITLTWDINSSINTLTGGDLTKLKIVGWDGSKWVSIPSTYDANNILGGISTTTAGSITTTASIIPNTYDVYTLGVVFICNAGSSTPILSSTTKSNVCPSTTVDLSTITASNLPNSTTLTWHSGTPATSNNKLSNVTLLASGTYYAAFEDIVNNCYSPTQLVTVTTTPCISATADNINTTAGTLINIPVLLNDTNNGANATLSNVTLPTITTFSPNGVTTVKPDGTIDFTPTAGFVGTTTFIYQICDKVQTSVCDTSKITVNVGCPTITTPTVTTTSASCTSSGIATVSNYLSTNTYSFTPSGPSVGSGGIISGMVAETSYTVTSSAGGCSSTASLSFSISSQLPTPTVPTVTTTSASCTSSGIATVSNYLSTNTYSFTPSGPSVGSGGIISGMVAETSYTVTSSAGGCSSTASLSFSISSQLPTPTVPTVTTTSASCTSSGIATVSNYLSTNTYGFTPSGPSVGSGGIISGMVAETSYTVTSSAGGCSSTASISFSISSQKGILITPALTNTSLENVCPAVYANLMSVSANNSPLGVTLSWHTSFPANVNNKIVNPTTVSAGLYYAAFEDIVEGCYSPTQAVLVTINTCNTINLTNICPDTTVNLKTALSLSGTAPVGKKLTWHYGTPATLDNKMSNPTAVVAGSYYAAFEDSTNNCYSQTQKVDVMIKPCLEANIDSITTTPATLVNIPVLLNDIHNGVAVTTNKVSLPTIITPSNNGVVNVKADGTIDFTPNTGFIGTTTFIYTICDLAQPSVCDTTSVTVSVSCPIIPKPSSLTAGVASLCIGNSTTLSGTCTSGTLSWYSDVALITELTSTTVSPTINTIYYAVCTQGVCKSISVPLEVSVSACNNSLSIVKNQLSISGQTVGSKISYSILVKNTGSQSLSNIVVTDANATITGGNPIAVLLPNASATVNAEHILTQSDLDSGKVSNTALASGKDPQNNNVSGISDAGTDVTGSPIPNPSTTDSNGDGNPSNDPTVFSLTPANSLSIVKNQLSISGQTVGSKISYSIVVKNTGSQSLSNVVVTDANATITGGNPIAVLLPNASATVNAEHILTQADLDSGKVSNTALASGKDPQNAVISGISDAGTDVTGSPIPNPSTTDSNGDGNPANDPTVFNLTPTNSLSVVKNQVSISGQTVGSKISYSIVVKNTGSQSLSNVVVTDANATITGGNPIAVLLPNASVTVNAEHILTQADLDSGKVSNTALASGKDPQNAVISGISDAGTDVTGSPIPNPSTTDSNGDGNPSNDPTLFNLTPTNSLSIVKNQLSISGQTVGSKIIYSILVKNTGSQSLSNVVVTDANATITGGNPIAVLLPNVSATVNAEHILTQADLDSGKVSNTALASGKDPQNKVVSGISDAGTDVTGSPIPNPSTTDSNGDGNPSNDPTLFNLTPTNSLSIVKNQLSISGQTVGSKISYSILVKNTGSQSLSNIVVTDANATITGGNPIAVLLPNASATVNAEHILTQADLDSGKVSNTALASGKDPQNAVISGISDAGTDVTGSPIPNPSTTDSNGDGNPANDPTVFNLTPTNSLSVVKNQVSISGQTVGSKISYSILVKNTGSQSLSNVVVTDANATITGGNPIAVLLPNASATVNAEHILTQADLDSGKVSNTALASGKDPQNNSVSGISDAGTDVTGSPIPNPSTTDSNGDGNPSNDPTVFNLTPTNSLSIVKNQLSISGQTVGSKISYSILVKNTGSQSLSNVVVTDANATITGGNPIAVLLPNASATVNAEHILTQADLDSGKVSNTALASGKDPQNAVISGISDAGTDVTGSPIPNPSTTDSNGDGNPSNDPTVFNLTPTNSLSVVKNQLSISGQTVGSKISYSILVKNTGSQSLSNVVVTDANATITGGNPIAVLLPNASATVNAEHILTQADLDSGKVSNTALASGKDPQNAVISGISDAGTDVTGSPIPNPSTTDSNGDGNPSNDPTVFNLTPTNSLSVVKNQVSISGQTVGSKISYSIVVKNTGSQSLSNIVVTDANATITGGNPIAVLLPNASATVNAEHILTQADLDSGKVSNTALASGKDPQNAVIGGVSDAGTDATGSPIPNPSTTDSNGDGNPSNDPTVTKLCPAPKALVNGGISSAIICSGGSATLSATGCSNGTITWTSSPISIVPANGIVSPTVTTTYTATCTNGTCVSSVSNPVTVIVGPCANPDGILSTVAGTPSIIAILANDKNADGTPADLAKITVPVVSTNATKGTTIVNSDGTISYIPNIGASGTDMFIYTICDKANPSVCDTAKVTISITAVLDVKLQLKVFLQGAFFSPSGATDALMRDDLRSLGVIPAVEPYTAMSNSRFTKVSDVGGQTIGTGVLTTTGSNAIVDWVFVELRDASNPSTVLKTRAALVQRDGDVVEASDGTTPVTFTGAVGTNYYVSVKHRNHLGAMTANSILMNATGTVVDFTTMTATQLWDSGLVLSDGSLGSYNSSEEVLLGNGKMALWAGNARNADNKVKYTGTSPDPASILSQVITYATNTGGLYNYDFVTPVYMTGDINLDGKVKYAGTFTDTAFILFNAINKYPNNIINKLYNFDFMVEQIP